MAASQRSSISCEYTNVEGGDNIEPYTHTQHLYKNVKRKEGSISDENEDTHGTTLRYSANTTEASKQPQKPASHPVREAPAWGPRFAQQWESIYTFWDNSWTPELLSCLVAVLALGGLLLVLGMYQGRVLGDLPIKISINAVISVFASIIKASLIMPVAEAISQSKWLWFSKDKPLADFERIDKASRGPWGSFLLVLKLKSRHFVTFGAWITIFALAIEPFTQQIISFHPCSQIVADSTPQLPRTQDLTRTGDDWGSFVNSMSAAVYLSLLGEPMGPSSMNFSCSTGNCSFTSNDDTEASHQTLGIGSKCTDISHFVKLDSNMTGGNISFVPGAQWHLPYFGGRTTIGEKTDTGLKYISRMRSLSWVEFAEGPYYSTMDGDALFRFTILTVNLDWSSVTEVEVELPPPGTIGTLTLPKSTPLAVECQLDPAIQTLQSKVENGVLIEKVLSAASGPWTYSLINYTMIAEKALRNGTWEDCTPSPDSTSESPVGVAVVDGAFVVGDLYWPKGGKKTRIQEGDEIDRSRKWYAKDCVWILDANAHLMPRRALSPHFNRQILEIDHGLHPYGAYKTNFSHMWMEQLYANGTANFYSISAFAADLASSMTTAIRNWGATELNWVQGKEFKIETCIAVQWSWVILPASLVLVSIEFLLLTIWSSPSRKSQQGPWKSSSLAVLFHGLDGRVRESCGDLPKRSEMWEKAEEVHVRLLSDDDGLKLK